MSRSTVGSLGYLVIGLVIAVIPVFLVSGPELRSPASLLQYAGGGLLVILGLGTLLGVSSFSGQRSRAVEVVGTVVGLVGLVGQFVL
ncbi:hypothetical protein [Halostella salina]|uniref:hypothetical protein n=1 Tax=Halostella salina TaxID=1547897 RepID=UPI000EF817A4|nr:hypothetical protein [Halostella salina]